MPMIDLTVPAGAWVLCSELAEGSWGAGGGIVAYAALKAASNAQKEEAGAPVAS